MMCVLYHSSCNNAFLALCLTFVALCQAYENVALGKFAFQMNQYRKGNETFDASNAVDGLKSNLEWRGGQCAVSAVNEETAAWWVDLGSIYSIHHITLYYRTENKYWDYRNNATSSFLGFSLYVSNTTNRLQGTLCFKDDYFNRSTIPAVFTTTCQIVGQYVIYYNERLHGVSYPSDYNEYAENDLCEVEVYGCPVHGSYFSNCLVSNTMTCHCPKCKPGFFGRRCQLECDVGHFGYNCNDTCGHCFDPKQCSKMNGICVTGCRAGFSGLLCKKECDIGHYGYNCNETCGQCMDPLQCSTVSGTCLTGCNAGFVGRLCKKECDVGNYGYNCNETCGQCMNATKCSCVSGTCLSGCRVGYSGRLCKKECDVGHFGYNCNETCGHCFDPKQCSKMNGFCVTGCRAGFSGLLCKKECDIGHYGYNCNETCGQCMDPLQCSTVSGTCLTGCNAGFVGRLCKKECDVGNYGYNCNETCGQCMNATKCSRVSGTCLSGCMVGYSGRLCKKVCVFGYYGYGCYQECSVFCNISRDCDPESGFCNGGCKNGGKGNYCLEDGNLNGKTTELYILIGVIGLSTIVIVICIFLTRKKYNNNLTSNETGITRSGINVSYHSGAASGKYIVFGEQNEDGP